MTPRTRRRRGPARALVAATAVAAVVGLGACSAVRDPSVAAFVDGRPVVTQAEVAAATSELPLEVSGGQPVDPTQVLSFLVARETVTDLARENGAVIGDREARQFLASVDEQALREPGTYSEATLDLISTNLMLGQLAQTPETDALVQERLQELATRLEVNPRYGRVAEDQDLFIVPADHPWLVDAG